MHPFPAGKKGTPGHRFSGIWNAICAPMRNRDRRSGKQPSTVPFTNRPETKGRSASGRPSSISWIPILRPVRGIGAMRLLRSGPDPFGPTHPRQGPSAGDHAPSVHMARSGIFNTGGSPPGIQKMPRHGACRACCSTYSRLSNQIPCSVSLPPRQHLSAEDFKPSVAGVVAT